MHRNTSKCTIPPANGDKNEWVRKHLGEVAHKRLILSHHKNLNMGDYLIDDRTANGADRFQGEHIHFGTEKFPSWDIVLDYLLFFQKLDHLYPGKLILSKQHNL